MRSRAIAPLSTCSCLTYPNSVCLCKSIIAQWIRSPPGRIAAALLEPDVRPASTGKTLGLPLPWPARDGLPPHERGTPWVNIFCGGCRRVQSVTLVGIDLGKQSFHLYGQDGHGKAVFQRR